MAAMSFSGAVLSGIGSTFQSGVVKTPSVGFVGFGKKLDFVAVSQRKKSSLIFAEKDGNILDDLNEATKKASDFATEKTKELLKDGEKAKDYVEEKNAENTEKAVEEGKKASEYVQEKVKEAGNSAAEFVEGKAGDAKDATK